MDGRPLADVRQRRGADAASTRAPATPSIETTTTTIERGATSPRATDTCRAAPRSAADGEPDRSAKGTARAARGGAPARRRAASTSTLDIVGPVGRRARRGGARRDRRGRGGLAVGRPRESLVGPVPLDRLLPLLSRLRRLRAADAARRGHSARAARSDDGGPARRHDARGGHSEPDHARESTACWSTSQRRQAVADAVARIVADAPLRRRLIANGYETARGHTLEAQAARMMRGVARWRHAAQPATVPCVTAALAGRSASCCRRWTAAAPSARRCRSLNALDERALGSIDVPVPARRAVPRRRLPAIVRLSSGDESTRASGGWRALRRFVRETRPDVVVSFLSYFSVLTAARAAGVGARVVFNSADADVGVPDRRRLSLAPPWHRRAVLAGHPRRLSASPTRSSTTSQGVADDLVAAFGVARARFGSCTIRSISRR